MVQLLTFQVLILIIYSNRLLLINSQAISKTNGNKHHWCVDVIIRVGVKYFSKYLSQVQVLFHICKYKYKFKYSEYLEDIKYIKYFFNQVRVKYKYFGNKQ